MSVATRIQRECQYDVTRSVCLPVNVPPLWSLGPQAQHSLPQSVRLLVAHFPTLLLLALLLGQTLLTSVLEVGGAKYHE